MWKITNEEHGGSKGELIKNFYISFWEGCLVLSRLVGSKDQSLIQKIKKKNSSQKTWFKDLKLNSVGEEDQTGKPNLTVGNMRYQVREMQV